MIHKLSCCRALQARRYEHEYESFRDDASSTTPSERERTVAADRRRPAGTIQRRSSGLYSGDTSRPSVLPAFVVLCTASSMVRGGMEHMESENVYRKFRQIATFHKVLVCPFFKHIPQTLRGVFILWRGSRKQNAFTNTTLSLFCTGGARSSFSHLRHIACSCLMACSINRTCSGADRFLICVIYSMQQLTLPGGGCIFCMIWDRFPEFNMYRTDPSRHFVTAA